MKLDKIGVVGSKTYAFKIEQSYIDTFQKVVPDAKFYVGDCVEDIAKQTDDLDMIISMPDTFTEFAVNYLKNAPSFRWVQSWVSGVDSILFSDLVKIDGLRVSAAREIFGPALSDHVIAFIYYYMREFPIIMEARKALDWDLGRNAPVDEAMAKTVGVIGLGNVGMQIARKCHLLGFRVLAAKRTPVECEWVEKCYPISELQELLPQCDYVVLILPHNSESTDMFGTTQFKAMKKSAYLINVARGAIVNEKDLIEALDTGEIAGAALDAFREEPLSIDNPIWKHDKIFMTYHQAAVSSQLFPNMVKIVAENLRRYQTGEPLLFEEKLDNYRK